MADEATPSHDGISASNLGLLRGPPQGGTGRLGQLDQSVNPLEIRKRAAPGFWTEHAAQTHVLLLGSFLSLGRFL